MTTRVLRGALRTARRIQGQQRAKVFAESKRRFSLWTGEAHDSFTLSHGRPPIYYPYLFVMSWPVRGGILLFWAIQSDIVEHTYYGYPPEDWYNKRPKFWRKRVKTFPWGSTAWRRDCDLMDAWCWKGIDPRDTRH